MDDYLFDTSDRERSTLRRLFGRPHINPFAHELMWGLGIDLQGSAVGLRLPYGAFDTDLPSGDVDLMWIGLRSSQPSSPLGGPIEIDLETVVACELKVGYLSSSGTLKSADLWDDGGDRESKKQRRARLQAAKLASLGSSHDILLRLLTTEPRDGPSLGMPSWNAAAYDAGQALDLALPKVVTDPDDTFSTVLTTLGAVPEGLEDRSGARVYRAPVHRATPSGRKLHGAVADALTQAFAEPVYEPGGEVNWPPHVLACSWADCQQVYATLNGLDTPCPACGSPPEIAARS